jgi:hypothetical protein
MIELEYNQKKIKKVFNEELPEIEKNYFNRLNGKKVKDTTGIEGIDLTDYFYAKWLYKSAMKDIKNAKTIQDLEYADIAINEIEKIINYEN